MYTEKNTHTDGREPAPDLQVVFKLRTTAPTRRAMHSVASEDRSHPKKGVLDRWLASKKLLSMEPVFGTAPRRGSSNIRRAALAFESEKDRALTGINVLTLSNVSDAKKACEEIKKDSMVEYAYIPPVKYVLAQDPLVNRQWGLNAIDLFQAERRAGFKPARNVKIAVIDSGIDANHPDLSGILVDEQNFSGGVKKDTAGHGTHVAGIVAAVSNNKIGIRGITNSIKIMSLKALNPYSAPGYYRAIRHAINGGAQVINFSLGGGYDPTEEALIRQAIGQGILVVAAMGNEKKRGNAKSYPAALAGVVAIGATDESDRIGDFSNTGTHIDLSAPGVNILSTIPTYPSTLAQGTGYEAWPGTSMATPMVSAAAALLLAKKPSATASQIRKALIRGADKVPGQTAFNTTYGHGRLNINASLKLI